MKIAASWKWTLVLGFKVSLIMQIKLIEESGSNPGNDKADPDFFPNPPITSTISISVDDLSLNATL